MGENPLLHVSYTTIKTLISFDYFGLSERAHVPIVSVKLTAMTEIKKLLKDFEALLHCSSAGWQTMFGCSGSFYELNIVCHLFSRLAQSTFCLILYNFL
jgi:hypothetical protein